MAYRIDTSGDLRPPTFTADGRLRADAYLGRTGVQTYRNPDGSLRREYRPASEVSSPESLASFEALPVTDEHPDHMLDGATRVQHARGATGDRVVMADDGRHTRTSIVVFDAALIAKMKAGKCQVSNGYTCDLDMTPGTTPEGEKYDAIQRNIRGNHVAIVHAGRAGTARVRMDDASVLVDDEATPAGSSGTTSHDDGAMIMDELKKALEDAAAQKARADQAEKDRDAQKARADKAEGERDAAVAAKDASEKKAREDAAAEKTARDAALDQARKDAVERVAVEAKAHTVLGAGEDGKARKFDGVETLALKLQIAEKIDGKVPADKAGNAAYVDARYDAAVSRFDAGAQAAGAAAAALGSGEHARVDGDSAEAKAAAKMKQNLSNAYKGGK
jgi:hypothetical protein